MLVTAMWRERPLIRSQDLVACPVWPRCHLGPTRVHWSCRLRLEEPRDVGEQGCGFGVIHVRPLALVQGHAAESVVVQLLDGWPLPDRCWLSERSAAEILR
eukprot:1002057-Alexandrium_andersonii.AAC.1